MSDRFFVDEKVVSFNFLGEQIEKEVSLTFDSFEQYFDFLNGETAMLITYPSFLTDIWKYNFKSLLFINTSKFVTFSPSPFLK